MSIRTVSPRVTTMLASPGRNVSNCMKWGSLVNGTCPPLFRLGKRRDVLGASRVPQESDLAVDAMRRIARKIRLVEARPPRTCSTFLHANHAPPHHDPTPHFMFSTPP